ncbi:FAD-dependent oxidoreductase [bacterium]|nr:FAD-dependent oxidoreductase [bacterium]
MEYDVIVVGGGTAGCAAAYMLGKYNKKVLVIEKNSFLGGTMTSALVTPMMKTSGNSVNNEFFVEFIKRMKQKNAAITYIDGNEGWFNPEIAKIVLDEMMSDAKVEVLFNSEIVNINISGRYINSIDINNNLLSVSIDTKYVIDSTGNCDVGFLSNCEFINKNFENQPTNLRFIMGGIDLNSFSRWLRDFDEDRNVTSVANINNDIHLSTAYTWDLSKKWALKPLFDDAVDNNILENEDRNYFQVFTIPNMSGSLAFNCPRVYFSNDINVLDNFDLSKALQKGRRVIYRMSEFCKKYFPGFENAFISNIADSLGIRVSRRIKGKYIYTIDDLKSGKKFENPVVVSNYPVDIHSSKKEKSVLETQMQEYQLPIEALMAADIDNLFVAGRCLSADFQAQAALRIIPSCFSMGVGVAKHILTIM